MATHEFELKFQVPQESRASLVAALRQGAIRRKRLQSRYFDTPQHALERAGLVLRLRQDGRRWTQTIKAAGAGSFDRLEYDAPRAAAGPAPKPDLSLYDPTDIAGALRDAFKATGEEPAALQATFETDVLRQVRKQRAGSSMVEIAFDDGCIRANGHEVPVLEVEFELERGEPLALVALAREWCVKHGLWLDPLSKSALGRRLAAADANVPAVLARKVSAARSAGAPELLAAVLESALQQVLANARELAAGGGGDEHVHQLRVGLRRLRTVLRELRDLPELAALPPELEHALTSLFRVLGEHRDAVVLVPQLQQQINEAGAPLLPTGTPQPPQPDVGAAIRASAFQSALLDLLALVRRLQADEPAEGTAAKALRRLVNRRLGKLHRVVLSDGKRFVKLEETDRHRVRKRLKRLRYLSELMGPLYPGKRVGHFVKALKQLQDALGSYQDVAVGRRLWTELALQDPASSFGAGWLSARERELARDCQRTCRATAKQADAFW